MNDYAALMINLPHVFDEALRDVYSKLKTREIVEIEKDPHVTVCYGLKDDDIIPLRDKSIFSTDMFKEVTINFSGYGYFEQPDQDVLFVHADSMQLEFLHYLIRKKLNPHVTYQQYQPHLTIAYLKKGTVRDVIRRLPYWKPIKKACHIFTFHKTDSTRIGFEFAD